MRSAAVINYQNDEKYCFLWSTLGHLHPIADAKNGNPTRVSNHRQCFDVLNNQGFDFLNGFTCSDVHKCRQINNSCMNVFELNFYKHDYDIWRYRFFPIEISESKSERLIRLMFYKNHYILIKKSHVSLGTYGCKFLCTRCLSTYSSRNVLTKHKQRCEP